MESSLGMPSSDLYLPMPSRYMAIKFTSTMVLVYGPLHISFSIIQTKKNGTATLHYIIAQAATLGRALNQWIMTHHFWDHPFYKRLLGPLPSNKKSLGALLKEAINNSLSLAVDGSHCPSYGPGSHGWVLASGDKVLWRGQGPTDGHPSILSRYRAELSGMLAGLHVLRCTCTYFDITTGEVGLFSDCFKAIKALRKDYQGITIFWTSQIWSWKPHQYYKTYQ
jgi:hypothetical protein